MSFQHLRDGYAQEKEQPKEYEPTQEEKELLERTDFDEMSSRVKLRLAYLKARMESREEKCDDNGNPNA